MEFFFVLSQNVIFLCLSQNGADGDATHSKSVKDSEEHAKEKKLRMQAIEVGYVRLFAFVSVCVCVCVRACVRVRACVCVCACAHT